ncbi:hypothetical protein CC78DRAFT_574081 [Lojkania enalia]|uniref:Uncharacterized protein n=1 Tax=Lojkania enalia TaxID=147567 RepID=A0A9P4NB46_9PLEO|nr:hypothetical protein CC78DRAFT_574081 [Didymosphaeria enalia]
MKGEHTVEAQTSLVDRGDSKKTLASKFDKLDSIVCNAGLGVGAYNETEDGLDCHMRKTTDSRIVFIPSEFRRVAPSSTSSAPVDEIYRDIGVTYPGNHTELVQVLFRRELQSEDAYGTQGKMGVKVVRPFVKDPVDDRCESGLYAAASPDIVTNKIQGQCIRPEHKAMVPANEVKDEKLAKNL